VITDTLAEPTTARPSDAAAYLLKLLAGPLVFAVVVTLPIGLEYQGRVALATFACVVVWWIAQPIPWAVASMLPFLVFPATGVMDIAATMRLYGQPIFFWIMGTVLMGYAIEKHGLARRIALAFLALPGVGSKAHRLTFTYMLMVGVVSMFVSDAATVAMMIPIGMSVVRHVRNVTEGGTDVAHGRLSNLAAFVTLGTLYAAVAGGTATMMGVPHNAIAISMLQRFTGRQLGFFEWMVVGVPVFLALLVTFFLTLWALVRPELRDLPGGETFLRAERAKLGPLRANERRVLFVFAVMVLLFVLPTIVNAVLGGEHPASAAVNRALSIWVVPPAVMFLLFGIRSTEPGSALLTWKDAERQSPWNIMILVSAGVAMTDAITQFGFVEMMGAAIGGLGIGAAGLPYLVAGLVSATTNMISGTAAATLYCGIFIPAAAQIGYNPTSMAILIANVAIGVVLPWAGATSASAFAGGEVDMRRMVRVGLAATAIFSVVVATIHLLMAGLL
jgi:solute carrier family 13 (sodium-dependent dicarboxylate transporter), member 2/3/5